MGSVCVSVVIPCYNAGKWIDRAIASIRAQDFTDYELIVVDDGSDDLLTQEKIAAYQQDPTIRVLIHEQNKGPNASRNTAIRVARGKYIATLDADDYYDSTFLSKGVAVLDEKSGVGIVYTYMQNFGERNNQPRLPTATLIRELFWNYIIGCCLFRKECFDACKGFDEGIRFGEEWDLWIRILTLGWKTHRIKEVLFFYQIREGSLSSKGLKQADAISAFIYKKHRELYAKYFWRIILLSLGEYIRRPYLARRSLPVFDLACKERLPRWLYVSLRGLRLGLWLSSYDFLRRIKHRLYRIPKVNPQTTP